MLTLYSPGSADNANPNRCSDCIDPVSFTKEFMPFATGVCGSCNMVRHVWDMPHLAVLKARGLRFTAAVGDKPAIGVLRNSFLDEAVEGMF